MSAIDIRRHPEEALVDTIIFANRDSSGTAKVVCVKKACLSQLDIVSQGSGELHVKYSDIDNMVAALKKAKELWYK
ncbi:MAG: hypothetical protein ACRC6V_08970 [Bacteroidales bacterium]